MSTTSRFASAAVVRFLHSATPAQRAWYLTRGEPQCLSGTFLDNEKGLIVRLYSGLRGVRLGVEVATPEEAIAQATATKARLLTEELEPVDEAALSIDSEAIDLAYRFNETGARIEQIVHIGSMNDGSATSQFKDALDDAFEEIANHLRRPFPKDAPLLADLETPPTVHSMPEIAEDLPILLRLAQQHPDLEGEELVEEFSALAHDEGAMGFLVQVSVPEHRPHPDGKGASVHGGIRHIAWRYASTYQVACDRALDWAEREIDQMWPQRKAA